MEILKSHGFLLNRLSNAVSTVLGNNLQEKYDVTLSQWAIISILGEHEALTSSEIQNLFNIRVSSATGILNRMEKKHLIQRVDNPLDKREKKLLLTEDALAIREDIINEVKKINQKMLINFSKAEKTTFKSLINKAFDNIILLDDNQPIIRKID